jgi:hypothetical protein
MKRQGQSPPAPSLPPNASLQTITRIIPYVSGTLRHDGSRIGNIADMEDAPKQRLARPVKPALKLKYR